MYNANDNKKNKLDPNMDAQERLDTPHPYYGFSYRTTKPKASNKGAPRGATPEKWSYPHNAYKTGEYSRWIQQRTQARFRNEGWELPFEDWLSIWEDSNKQELRGTTKECYVMTRSDLSLAWSPDNVVIVDRHSVSVRNGRLSKGNTDIADIV